MWVVVISVHCVVEFCLVMVLVVLVGLVIGWQFPWFCWFWFCYDLPGFPGLKVLCNIGLSCVFGCLVVWLVGLGWLGASILVGC